jgi:ribonuclease E
MLDHELNNNGIDDNEANAVTNGAAHDQEPDNAAGQAAPPPVQVPAVLFQAPQVLFQPPQPVTPPASGTGSRGTGARGTAPASRGTVPAGPGSSGPGSSGPGSSGPGSSGPGSSGTASGGPGEEADEEAGPSGPARGRRPGARTTRTRTARDRARESAQTDASEEADDDAIAAADQPADAAIADDEAGEGLTSRRRRRRDRRGRGRAEAEISVTGPGIADESDTEAADTEAAEDEDEDEGVALGPEGVGTSRRRRRKRRRGTADVDVTAPDDPPDTVVHVREPHNLADDVRAIKGSTRLEAKKQRRREGRESGRRRPPVVTESEFLARRESVERTMLVRQRGDRTQMAVLEDGILVEHYVNRTTHQSYVGNVYLGKVQNVLPSMEAAFVDIGKGRNAVLYAGEVNFDASGLEGQPKRIESALKPGQSLIVQVTKDPVGHKGARLTSQVSLPGRYLVYVPGASMTGISRKLPDTERNRLKHILKKVTPENAGVIVRTAAEGAAEAELERDVTRLAAQWETIEKKAKTATAPALLYGEPDLTIRVVRDVFNEDFSRLIVSGDQGWDVIDEYVRYVAPHLAERIERWGPEVGDSPVASATGADDVFAAYRVDEQLAKALERKVWLPSGGSLVIDRTEAMTVIDVNTGKFTGQGGNLEETVTRNNLEAAEEIVRQLRLRDVGGIVVIDFIDMVLESNRELVLRRLLECLARDRTKHQVAEVTSLGLVQMTRKRVGAGLLEAFSEPCEACSGRGVIVHFESAEANGYHASRRGGDRRELVGVGSEAAPGKRAASSNGAALGQGGVLADTGESGQPGGSGHGGRRNRRDRGRGGSPAVAQAIAGVASATLSVSSSVSDDEVLSVDPAAAVAPAVHEPIAGGTPVGDAASETAAISEADVAPVADVPPAPPGRRTRSGRATVRRVTTSDEPVTVVVTVPPISDVTPVTTAPEPAAEPESVAAEVEPVTEAVPVAEAAPFAEAEPVTEAGAVAEAAPVADAEPVVEAAAAPETEPVAQAEPVADVEPVAQAELAAEATPVADVEPVAEPAPVAEPESHAEAEPFTAEATEPVEAAAMPDVAEVHEAAEASGPTVPSEDDARSPVEDSAPSEAHRQPGDQDEGTGFLFEG